MSEFKNKTYCASPKCTNACGKAMTDKEKEELYSLTWEQLTSHKYLVSYEYFCGEPETCEHD